MLHRAAEQAYHTSFDKVKKVAMFHTKKSVVAYLFNQNKRAAPVTFRPQKHRTSSPVVMIESYKKATVVELTD